MSFTIGTPNDSYPTTITMGFGPGSEGSMGRVPYGLPNPFPMTGMPTSQDGGRSFGTGVSASNFTSVNANFVHDFTRRFPKEAMQKEMIAFMNRSHLSDLLRLPVGHELASLQELNRWLISPEGRDAYGKDKSCSKLVADFGLIGTYNASIPDYVTNDQTWDASSVLARRARTNACVTRAYKAKGQMMTDRILTYVHLLVIRKRLVDTTMKPDAASQEEEDKQGSTPMHYWGLYPCVTEYQSSPAPWLYIDDEAQGTCIRVGFISDFTSSNEINDRITERSRSAILGRHTAEDRKVYQEAVCTLPTVDIVLT